MKEDACQGIVLQDPVEMGYQAAKSLVESLEGRKLGEYVSTGEFVATPKNMEEEKIKSLLSPKKFGE